MTIGAFGENYEQDKNGRSVKITQTLGGQTYTKRFGYYKQGDHATNRMNTIYYSKNGVSDGRGVSPMIGFIKAGEDLNGFSVADKIVGKAVAMLFVKAGIKEVYAEVLSESGKDFLERNGVKTEYKTLTERIINRAGTDVCPMEKAVTNLSDVHEAYAAILEKTKRIKKIIQEK